MQTQAVSLAMPKSKTKIRLRRAERRALNELEAEYKVIFNEFNAARSDLNTAIINYDYLSEPSAVDVCIFKIRCAQSRCDNLIKLLKNLQCRISSIKE